VCVCVRACACVRVLYVGACVRTCRHETAGSKDVFIIGEMQLSDTIVYSITAMGNTELKKDWLKCDIP